jgi:voltage-gated potassium channel
MADRPPDPRLQRQRWRLLHNVVRTLEPAMTALGFLWLTLLVIDFTRGLSPALSRLNELIWAIFVLDFALEFIVAPRKTVYLKRHWIVAVSLAVPVIRIARFARLLRIGRVVRGAKLARTLGSLNRSMSALRATMRRRGLAYVIALTALTTAAGAAAMYAFENGVPDPSGIHDYATALWWTAMIMTTMGSAYWPQTAEGRVLCVLLALYAFAVFGYVTATLATFFIDRDTKEDKGGVAGRDAVEQLRDDIASLRSLVEDLRARPQG